MLFSWLLAQLIQFHNFIQIIFCVLVVVVVIIGLMVEDNVTVTG